MYQVREYYEKTKEGISISRAVTCILFAHIVLVIPRAVWRAEIVRVVEVKRGDHHVDGRLARIESLREVKRKQSLPPYPEAVTLRKSFDWALTWRLKVMLDFGTEDHSRFSAATST